MARFDDIDPQDIDPDTGRPYPGYSSPAIDTSFHDHEMAVDDDPDDQVRELLKQWKCSCTEGFYLQRSRVDPRRHGGFGEWIVCSRCSGSGLDPRATKALALLPREPETYPNGAPMFSADGTMLDDKGNRSIFDDIDEGPDGDDDDACTNPGGHKWAYTGTQYGGDDERWQGEGRCYCEHCGADGDA